MLKITGDGRKAALDMRLVDPFADAHGDTKIGRAVDRIRSDLGRDRERALDPACLLRPFDARSRRASMSTTNSRSQLIASGIPKSEIAFIHDAETDAAKMKLFNAVNAGRVRILIGSTEKMGAGTNVQRRLARACIISMRPGGRATSSSARAAFCARAISTPKCEIYRYVTEGSFDAYMWQTLETKARFIQQVMSGQTSVRTAEDLEGGALTYAEIKAIASGNPAVMEKVKIDTEIRKLDQLRAAHLNQQHSIRWQLRNLPEKIAEAQRDPRRICRRTSRRAMRMTARNSA